jgi:nicotinamide mononucleotide (NMN) deamidase PncC
MFSDRVLVFAQALITEAREKQLRIVTAESCTGGLIAGALTEIPGASEVVDRGFIVYSNNAKTKLLSVRAAVIMRFGAVSEDVARAMAEGALKNSAADIAVSCTGNNARRGMPLWRHRTQRGPHAFGRSGIEAAAADYLTATSLPKHCGRAYRRDG